MLILRIDKNGYNKDYLVDYLREVALLVEKGELMGEDWEIEGGEEPLPPEEPIEENLMDDDSDIDEMEDDGGYVSEELLG